MYRSSILLVVLLLVNGICGLISARAQDVLAQPRVKLAGEEGQLTYLLIRYFDSTDPNTPTDTTYLRSAIDSQKEPIELEFGHAGIRLLLFAPGERPVTATLFDGESVIEQTSASEGQFAEIRYGAVPAKDEFALPRFELNADEQALAREFLDGLEANTLSELIANNPNANIEPVTVRAYVDALKQHLGNCLPANRELDGWMSWQGQLGARVIAGRLLMDNGHCDVQLIVIESQLYDLIVAAPKMRSDWFQGPDKVDEYRVLSDRLNEWMFDPSEDAIAKIRGLFRGAYKTEITVDGLRD